MSGTTRAQYSNNVKDTNEISSTSETTEPVLSFPYSIGDLVDVQPRMTTGINKPGGVGRVIKIISLNQQITINVKYVLGGGEKNIDLKFIKSWKPLSSSNEQVADCGLNDKENNACGVRKSGRNSCTNANDGERKDKTKIGDGVDEESKENVASNVTVNPKDKNTGLVENTTKAPAKKITRLQETRVLGASRKRSGSGQRDNGKNSIKRDITTYFAKKESLSLEKDVNQPIVAFGATKVKRNGSDKGQQKHNSSNIAVPQSELHNSKAAPTKSRLIRKLNIERKDSISSSLIQTKGASHESSVSKKGLLLGSSQSNDLKHVTKVAAPGRESLQLISGTADENIQMASPVTPVIDISSRQSTFINLARTIMAQEMDDTMQLSLLLEMVNAKCSGDDETFSVQEAQVYLKSLEELNIIMFVEGNIYRI